MGRHHAPPAQWAVSVSAPVVHGPGQLPDLRLWLADQWAPGRTFYKSAAPYHAGRAAVVANVTLGRADVDRSAVLYAQHERALLQRASLWWVGDEMVDLLLASAAGVPDDVHVRDLPPMPAEGLVVLAKPWLGLDGYDPDNRVTVDALTWGMARLPARQPFGLVTNDAQRRLSLTVSTYRYVDYALGLDRRELDLATRTGAINHAEHRSVPAEVAEDIASMARGQGAEDALAADPTLHAAATLVRRYAEYGTFDLSEGGRTVRALTGRTWVPLGRSDWPVDDALGIPPWDDEPEQATASMVEDRKVLAALFTLLHQEGITRQTVHRPERQAMRRTQRAGVEPKLAEVRVVTLRKLHRTDSVPSEDDEHARREWSHRWLVAGHWRWQPVGKGRTERRLTYVRPHVKGPDDKPLRVPTRVNAWVR